MNFCIFYSIFPLTSYILHLPSYILHLPSAISHQPSAISLQPSALSLITKVHACEYQHRADNEIEGDAL
jgi:hypothetical protein